MPSTTIDISSWSHISSLKLADPSCHKPSPIDVLLGAEIFASLLLPGNIVGTRTQPSAINSVFGWLLTGSRNIALRCFHSLERRLAKNPDLRQQYVGFMKDYLDSGHMCRIPVEELDLGKYYIPHHCVQRPESRTTKLRVVFNASSKDAVGVSLNDTLLIGPKLQTNIVEILLKFRFHSVVFTCDMRQMYRMISLLDSDRDYQRIFWRFNSCQPIQEYRLNTVTYGVSSAPFLACRTVKQLIIDEGKEFPLASEVLSSQLYIDDIVSGFESLEKAVAAKLQVIELLKKGNFELRKWASNVPALLADLPPEHCLTSTVTLDVDDNHTLKVLGLKWNPHNDCFFLYSESSATKMYEEKHPQ
ncbi:unnamed protein product [Leptosia nina]|uniref:Reverse transcriptase domain-containing protein n=1 Tax=Leptosia nina TaxID=320188 RepID=A0AAV1J1H4_9NEOP